MMVSGSMPFSLASASIVCINGFCMLPITSSFHCKRATEPRRHGASLFGSPCLRASVARDSKLDFQPAARNESQRQPVHSSVRRLEQHVAALHPAEPPFERLLVVHRLPDDHLGEPAGE